MTMLTKGRSEPTKEWSLGEWIQRFVQDDRADYHEYDDDDLTNPIHEQMIGGDDLYDEVIDDGILESFIIVSLAAALAFLVYYRQQRQLNHRREVEQQNQAQVQAAAVGQNRAPAAPVVADGGAPGSGVPQQQRDEQQQGQGQGQEQGQAPDRGFFPQPGDAEYGQWVAGGIMH